jgi:tetratricopeptide (TPR) repeat protein
MRFSIAAAVATVAVVASAAPAEAASPREELIRAAFLTHDKAQALGLVDQAITDAQAILAQSPNDREAKLQQALGIGYRGQLKRSPGDAKSAHTLLEALAKSDPRDAEAQVAVAGWHLTAVGDLGNFLARTLLGASRDAGIAALDRAVALGGNRAFFSAYAALIRIKLDSSDTATPLKLAQRAAAAPAPGAIDRVMQRAAQRIVPLLQAGDGAGASKLAKQLLPFGTLS